MMILFDVRRPSSQTFSPTLYHRHLLALELTAVTPRRPQDYGWGDAGWHRVDVRTGKGTPDPDVQTPNMDALIKDGIEMDRQYVYKYCSPTRSGIQSGRHPVRWGGLPRCCARYTVQPSRLD
jgi:hypothetical protein